MKLLDILAKTHQQAALRDNASTQILIATYHSNGRNMIGAITAAMNTIGGFHAPIKATYRWLYDVVDGAISVDDLIDRRKTIIEFDCIKGRLPGFGSSFHKDGVDPILYAIAAEFHRSIYEDISVQVSRRFNNKIFPNLAFYTAAVSHHLNEPINLCESIIIKARIPIWLELLEKEEKK